MVVSAPVRDALDMIIEETAAETAYRKPQNKPVEEENSEDLSEAQSTESLDTPGFTDSDSQESTVSRVVEKDKVPSAGETGVDKNDMGSMDVSSSSDQDLVGRELGRSNAEQQTSRELVDSNSEEGIMVADEAEHLSGKHIILSSGHQVTHNNNLGNSLQRKASPRGDHGLNGVLTPGLGRALPAWDSFEDDNGKPDNRGDADFDETRELMSSETYPIAPLELKPGIFSVTAKSRVS
ncbi:uncharacterized protein [Antennarius striatus]|uniref:uncharacterized protein n=1 Tax=Antennarius striatus TaxID=241820 RepID=UPI0035AD9FA4